MLSAACRNEVPLSYKSGRMPSRRIEPSSAVGMKTAAVLLCATLVVVGVVGGRVYDEKGDAVQGVEKRFEGVKEKVRELLAAISNDRKFDEFEKASLASGEKNRDKAIEDFNTEKMKTTKAAIAKGKLSAAIDCILRVVLEGEKLIPETHKNFEKILRKYNQTKTEELDFATREAELIMAALEDLKKEALAAIESAKNGFLALKNEFVKKGDTAEKQLTEIDRRISQINIKEDYKNLQIQNTNKNKEVVDSLSKKMQKCIN